MSKLGQNHVSLTILSAGFEIAWAASTIAAAPIPVGTDKQVFIDGRFIESQKNVQLVVNPPRSTGEKLVVYDKPWEDMALGDYVSVVQDGDRIHMWYEVMDRKGFDGVAYACSADGGAKWTKPSLGIITYADSTDNNLVVAGIHGMHVFRNRSDAPANERYCMFVGTPNQGYYSPDGLHWTTTGKKPFLNMGNYSGLDSQNVMFWDTRIKKYVAMPRVNLPTFNRAVGRSESNTFGDFPAPAVVFARDNQDSADMDFYTSGTIQYPYAADTYFMFPAAYHHTPPPPGNDGPIDIQFAASRDGIRWLRTDRRPIIRLGLTGQWNGGVMYAGYGLSRSGDELSLYYTGTDVTHGGYGQRGYLRGTITRAIYRLDGFMSVDAAYEGGEFTTPAILFNGDQLEVNFDGSAGGWAKVELLKEDGSPIPGFTAGQCDKITRNEVAKKVSWGGKADLSAIKDTPVKLRFTMRDAKLYAFQFVRGRQ